MKAAYSSFPAEEEAHTSSASANGDVFVAPASFAQRRLWFLHQLDPTSAAYNMTAAVRLEGRLDFDALERSFNEIVRRHESLRTSFTTIDEEPMQVVAAKQQLRIERLDLRVLPKDEREEEVKRETLRASERPFDLAQGELLRISLLDLSDEESVMVLVMSHIISDGWSMGVLVREMVALYGAFSAGAPSPLPELEIQYLDFAQWQKEWLTGSVLENQMAYWKRTLGGKLPVLELPADVPRRTTRTLRGANEPVRLPFELSKRLKALSRERGATLFMTLLTAFQVLLQRYTGLEDLLVGTPVAGRARPETQSLIGFFANTLVMRTSLAGNPRFSDLLANVRETAFEAQAHGDIPFEMLVEELQPERNLSHTPIFQVMFVLQNTPLPDIEMAGLRVRPLVVEDTSAKFDLTLSLKEEASGLAGTFQYSAERFTRGRMQRLAGHFQKLLEGIVADPQARISDLPLLIEDERQQILLEWNDTATTDAPEHCLHRLIEEQVARTPDAVALIFEDVRLTYSELNARANQLARRLRRLGVKTEMPVAISVERSIEMVVGLLGILKAGAAYLPLDPSHPPERLSFTLADTQATVLLTQASLREALPECSAQVVCLDTQWEEIAEENADDLTDVGVTPGNLAYVIYTSGSTGQPKGAMIAHRAISNRLLWMQDEYRLDATDRVMQKTPYSFDVSVWEFFWPLMTGAALVVARPGGHQDSAYLVELIEREHVTTLHFVPSMLQVFVEEAGLERCASLRRVICSGEALSFDLQERFQARLDAALHNLYGPTEAAVDVTYWACERDDERRIVPIGRPIANTQIYLLDRQLQPVPVGVLAELYIGGEGLGRGYFRRADLTAERFIPNPFAAAPGARLYQTGDVCRHLSDGAIEYLGRSDHQVKIRGFRIELGEIEALLSSHPHVRAALVLAREDKPGDKRLIAYVVTSTESATGAGHLREHLRARVPEYMMPSFFVMLAALPVMPNGKIDRAALPAPESVRGEEEREYVAPRTEFEIKVAGIWADVLRVERVGINDNFFDLGGHSLLATRVVSRVNEACGQVVTLRTIFEKPTLAQFALVIEENQNTTLNAAPALIKPQPRGRQNLARLLENLEQLSEQEAKELLTQKKHVTN